MVLRATYTYLSQLNHLIIFHPWPLSPFSQRILNFAYNGMDSNDALFPKLLLCSQTKAIIR